MTRLALVLVVALTQACPAIAGQGEPAITQPSAFLAGTTNLYDRATGQRIGIIRPSPFVAGDSSLYSQPDNQRLLLIEPSPFLDGQLNLYTIIGHD